MYADDSGNDRLPPTDFNPEKDPGSGPYQSYWMFDGPMGLPADLKHPHNLAYLYTSKIITAHKVFYDPGLRHPDLIEVRFDLKYYENAKYPWPSPRQRERWATTCIPVVRLASEEGAYAGQKRDRRREGRAAGHVPWSRT
jgi:hypothetical protein